MEEWFIYCIYTLKVTRFPLTFFVVLFFERNDRCYFQTGHGVAFVQIVS
jgi:hypothetical protein